MIYQLHVLLVAFPALRVLPLIFVNVFHFAVHCYQNKSNHNQHQINEKVVTVLVKESRNDLVAEIFFDWVYQDEHSK